MLPDTHLYRFALPLNVFGKLKGALLEANERTLVDRNQLIADIGNSIWFDFKRTSADLVEQCITFLYPLAVPNGGCAGAEWWIRITGANEPKCWHFDRDERLGELTGIIRHPKLASVLYLSAEGGPTLVTDQVFISNSVCAESFADLSRVISPAMHGALIKPVPNQFLIFPGQFRHCVLPGTAEAKGTRLTLLINWWLEPPLGLPEVRTGHVAEVLSGRVCEQCANRVAMPEEMPITFIDGQEIGLIEGGVNV